MINKSHSIIFGISGFSLTANEIDFFKKFRPWGIILFARNINSLFLHGKLNSFSYDINL